GAVFYLDEAYPGATSPSCPLTLPRITTHSPDSWSRWRGQCITHTSEASSIVTSNQPTFCSTPRGSHTSLTLAWPSACWRRRLWPRQRPTPSEVLRGIPLQSRIRLTSPPLA